MPFNSRRARLEARRLQQLSVLAARARLSTRGLEQLPRQTISVAGAYSHPMVLADNYGTDSRSQISHAVDPSGVIYSPVRSAVLRYDARAGRQLPDLAFPAGAPLLDAGGYVGCAMLSGRYLALMPRGSYQAGDVFAPMIWDRVSETYAFASLTLPDISDNDYGSDVFGHGTAVGENVAFFPPRGNAPRILRLERDPASGAWTAGLIPIDYAATSSTSSFWSFECGELVRADPASRWLVCPVVDTNNRTGGSYEDFYGRLVLLDAVAGTARIVLGGTARLYSRFGQLLNTQTFGAAEPLRLAVGAVDSALIGEGRDTELCRGGAYDPSSNTVVMAPWRGYTTFRIALDAALGTVDVSRKVLTVTHPMRSNKWSTALYNPVRGSVILVPARHPAVVEVRGTDGEAETHALAILRWPLSQDNYVAMRGAVVGSAAHILPLGGPLQGVLRIPLATDPGASTLPAF
jgi:hypothetical protein